MTHRDRHPRSLAPSQRLVGLYRATLARLPLLYFAWALVVGLIVVWVTPPWQNPDEGAHVERAIQIGLGELVGERVGPYNAGGLSDPGVNTSVAFIAGIPFHPQTKATAAILASAGAVKSGRPARVAFDNTATYPPFLYAAAAAAAWFGRAAHMHLVATLRLMRACNALAAAAIGAAALANARRTRVAIAAVLLLPMSVALAASPSQDALLVPVAAWAAACIDRMRSEAATRDPDIARQSAAAGLLLLVMLARPPYLPLALLLLALPGPSLRPKLGLTAALAATVLLWSGYVAWQISVPMYLAVPSRQAIAMLSDPLGFLRVVDTSLSAYGSSWAASTIGVFGWTDTTLPTSFLWAAQGALLLTLLAAAGPDPQQAGRWWSERSLPGLLAVAAAFVGILSAIYVIWCAPGATTIYGIQGRYFLPLLPALALGMPDLGRWAAVLRPPALVAVLLLAAIGPAVTVTTLVDRYYLIP